jgi:two-component system, sensor histidine kinase and response regulator
MAEPNNEGRLSHSGSVVVRGANGDVDAPLGANSSPGWRLLQIGAVAGVYYLAARLGLLLQLPGTNASPVWPPSGIGLAAVLLFGLRVWPGILIGAFLANLMTLPLTGAGFLASAGICVGNTLEHVVALLLIRRLVGWESPFEHAAHVFRLIATAVVSSAVASTCGTASLWLTGIIPGEIFNAVWFTWWLGDTAGMLIMAPAIYCWWRQPRLELPSGRALELAALTLLTIVVTELLFGGWIASDVINSLPYLVVPGLLWAAFRFGPRETATMAVLISVIAVMHTWQSMHDTSVRQVFAPFVGGALAANSSLLMLQIFVSAVAITAMTLAAAVSQQRGAEQEVRALNETLEHRVQKRTIELAEKAEQLEEQRQTAVTLAEELKKADKAKNEFLANMSHEIRTPMNAVMGLTELVLGSELDDIQRDYLSTVMDSAESLLSVINDILDFSKIEAGMLKFEDVEFQLYDTVGDTVRAQALRAQRKELELVCFIDPAIPFSLKGDPGRLRQVLMNLIGNAIKFTEAGEVVVRVEQKADENGQLMLGFSVSDTGIGVAQDKIESIFEPFEQADMSTTREFGGTGLGLAICHKLVSLMGGRIDVDSEPGRGSTFQFTAGFAAADTQSHPATIPEDLTGTRVLVVDDNATNRTILEQILLAKAMVPVTAPSALDGFTLLQDAFRDGRPFRLLISDVHMPKVDGFGFVEMIRADASLSALDIILLTSTGQQGDQQRCAELRIDAQLTKPVKQSELYNIILRVLGFDAPDEGWLSIHEPVPGELPSLRILLVEDSPANQKVALAMLSGAGHTTVVANHGKEALVILETQDFDVILMDVQMPVMDGLQATAAIRAGETGIHDHLPIVAMTAHAMSGDRDRCLAAGMDEYVSKPVYRKPLFKAIAAAIGIESTDTSISRIMNSSGILQADAPTKLVDWTGPLSQLSGDHAVLKEITESYLNETKDNLSRLPAAIAAGNARESLRLAHTVKGAMRFFHAAAAHQSGQELEDMAATGDLTSANQAFEKLKQEVEPVLAALQRFIDRGEM